MLEFQKLTKAVLWDRTTGQVRLWVEDVPLETTKEELVALVTQAAVGIKWQEWRNLQLETTAELSVKPIQSYKLLLNQRDRMRVTMEQLIESLPK